MMTFKRKIYLGVGVGAVALVGGVALQNMEPVGFQFLFWRVAAISKLLLLVITFLIGIGVGFLLGKRPWSR